MKNVVQINNVVNHYTKEEGSLILYVNTYSPQALENRGMKDFTNSNVGLNIYFKTEDKEPQYIKSFVLTHREISLMYQKRVNVVSDLGYILKWGVSYIEIVDMGTYVTTRTEITNTGCSVISCGVHTFDLDMDSSVDKDLINGFEDVLAIACNIHNKDITNSCSSLCDYIEKDFNVVYDL